MNTRAPHRIQIHPADNVAIVANDGGLKAGTVFDDGLTLVDNVPQGHKVSLTDLAEGDPVLRYNVVIGHALKAIPRGGWVHERLLRMPAARELDGLPIATVTPPAMPPLEGFTFEGYRNPDGSVGTRNILAITQTVQCVAGVTEFAVQRIKKELLPKYPNVDDVVALAHTYGCGVAIDAPDAVVPIRTLRNISLNPNFGGEVMVVSLGCEKLQPERLMPPGTIALVDERDAGLDLVRLQDDKHVGFQSMIDSILASAEQHLQRLNQRRRETVPASELVVGVQCGGSDAFSGVTANPAVGFATDLLVRAGATVMFSENTEVRDAVDQLAAILGPLQDVPVLVLGIGYRGDVREDFFSSALLLREALAAAGAAVHGHDPYYDDEHLRRRGFIPYDLAAPVPVRAAILQAAHAAYRDLDPATIPGLEVLLDGLNALDRARVEAAGVRYLGVGR